MPQPAERERCRSGPRDRPLLNARLLGSMMVTLNGRRCGHDVQPAHPVPAGLPAAAPAQRDTARRADGDLLAGRPAGRGAQQPARRADRSAAGAGPGLAGEVLERRHGSYRLARDLPVWVDVDEFERSCRGRAGGPTGSAPTSRRWPPTRPPTGSTAATCWPRTRTRTGRRGPASRCASTCSTCSAGWPSCTPRRVTTPPAVLVARRALDIDPCNEPLHRQLMRSYRDTGQVHLALTQFHRCAEALWQEHPGRARPAETVELHERLQPARRSVAQARQPREPVL